MKALKPLEDYLCFGLGEKPSYLVRWEIGHRGGGIVIDAKELIKFRKSYDDDTTCGTYQNYLGGGMLGRIGFGANFSLTDLTAKGRKTFKTIVIRLTEIHHALSNHDDEWESQTLEQNQKMPTSAY